MPGNPTPTQLATEDQLTADQVIAYWLNAGGPISTAGMALARAYSESSLRAAATSANPDGGTNVGLYQLDTPGGVGTGYSVTQLENPATNTAVTVKATKGGQDWSSWSDDYQQYLPQATADVKSFQAAAGQNIGTYVKDILGDVTTGVEDVTGLGGVVSAAQSLAKDFEGLAKVLTWVSMPSSWVRIFAGVFGAASLGAGIYLIGKEARGS